MAEAPEVGTPRPRSLNEIIHYYANRPSTAYDEVVLQADYCLRALLSFYRFRRLGGGRDPHEQINFWGAAKKDNPLVKLGLNQGAGRGVHYVSDHPEVRLFSFSVIALLVLFESAANAYFFSKQSEFGFVGGLFQAMAVSLANVATSYFIIGYWGLRHITVPFQVGHRTIKLFAILAIGLGLIMILMVNLSAAHYRNVIDIAAEGLAAPKTGIVWPTNWGVANHCAEVLQSDLAASMSGAAANALCRPFTLYSLDAMVLFALGLAISALAAFEGRRSDHPFPGLSNAARRFEQARRDLQDSLADYQDGYDEVIAEIKKDLAEDKANGFEAGHRTIVYAALDARVEPFRRLLTTSQEFLSDEFALETDVIEAALKGRSGADERS